MDSTEIHYKVSHLYYTNGRFIGLTILFSLPPPCSIVTKTAPAGGWRFDNFVLSSHPDCTDCRDNSNDSSDSTVVTVATLITVATVATLLTVATVVTVETVMTIAKVLTVATEVTEVTEVTVVTVVTEKPVVLVVIYGQK